VIDAKKERIALREASILGIPAVALVDTNSDPDDIPYVIPSNDDAIRTLRLLTSRIADRRDRRGAAVRESRTG